MELLSELYLLVIKSSQVQRESIGDIYVQDIQMVLSLTHGFLSIYFHKEIVIILLVER